MPECNVPCKQPAMTLTETLTDFEIAIHHVESDLGQLEEILIPIVDVQVKEMASPPVPTPLSQCELSRSVEKLTLEVERIGDRIRTLTRIIRI